ncbi:TonB-dependent receptor [Belliella marina]|uniref:TonB-dependent receptor n=1 Tax=Belliella marina TaxID=1644146 RepID=A0ABW4VNK2_9BACT
MKNLDKLLRYYSNAHKLKPKIKYTVLFFLLFLVRIQVYSYSQDTKIVLNLSQASLEELFASVEEITHYKFLYHLGDLDLDRKIDVQANGKPLDKVLDEVFLDTNIQYALIGRQIVLTVKDVREKEVQKTPVVRKNITGVVRDEKGIPLIGVTIIIKGSSKGVVSGNDGSFRINANSNDVLIFSFIGFEKQEVLVGDQSQLDIILKEAENELGEFVVVGYGETKRSDLTGSVGSVDSKDIQQLRVQTVDQALIGKISGVHVSSQSGGPGSGAIVHVRGLSQLIGDNQPLYVIDGVPVVINPRFGDVGSIGVFGDRENPLLSINPDDIERVDVLKDASSAAIYGSRAANGVVLVTTKRGKRNQKPKLDFSTMTTVQNPLNTYDVLNASQYRDFLVAQGQDQAVDFGNADTDWQREIVNHNAIWTQHNLSISGGTSDINYLVSGNVSDQEGVMLGNKFSRYNLSSSLDADITEELRIGFNFSYNYSVNRQSGLASIATGAFYRPDLPVFNESGQYSSSPSVYGFAIRNPVGDQGKVRNHAVSRNVLGNVYGEYKIIEGLRFRSQLSLNLNNDRSSIFNPSFTTTALFRSMFYGTNGALMDVQHNFGFNKSWANTLNYNKNFGGNHTIDAVAGISWDHSRLDLESQEYSDFPDDEILVDIRSANQFVRATSDVNEMALNSLFGRVNYNFQDRILATLTARYDGSVKFGPENQWGFFPSGAVAWNVHNEGFLKDVSFLDQFKLRASMGRTGSDNLPSFSYLAYYRALGNGDSRYNNINGIVVEGVPNSAIRWEQTEQLDLGLEFGLFNNRIYGEVVYFQKNTNGIILMVPLPAQTGSSRWNANIADVTNRGWEIGVGSDIISKPGFRWNSSFNISFIENKVVALHGGTTTAFGSAGILEGQPMGVIIGYDVVSIAQSSEEINALNAGASDGRYQNGLNQPGDYIYRDINGDGKITNDDRIPLGDINPDFFGGWNNTVRYKSFDFIFNFNFVKGVDRLWERGANQFAFVNPFNNVTTHVNDTWTPENVDAQFARMGSATHGTSVPTSRNVMDASYIKLRAMSIAYNIPDRWLSKTKIHRAQISLSGNNLFVITKYPGLDPESVNAQRGGSTVDLVRDGGFAYPQMRNFSIGAKLSL